MEDKGGKIKNFLVDIFFASHKEARKFGRKVVLAEFCEENSEDQD